MKKLLKIGAVVVVILAGLVIWISPPRFIREIGLPSVAQGLPSEFALANAEFNDRVQAKYKAGMSESELLLQLTSEGFLTNAEFKYAEVSRSGFPCSLEWRITWHTVDGAISDVQGNYRALCI